MLSPCIVTSYLERSFRHDWVKDEPHNLFVALKVGINWSPLGVSIKSEYVCTSRCHTMAINGYLC